MIYEYLIDIIYTDANLGEGYSYNRLWWGEDEYHALTGLMVEYDREEIKDNAKVKLHLSRVRPTGRQRADTSEEIEPYVNCDARPYIKGLITRFMNSFIVSDTIIELEKHKIQYEEYLLNYKVEFPDYVLKALYNQCREQRNKIEDGIIKPISYTIMPYSYTESGIKMTTSKEDLSNHLSSILKTFGFGIRKEGENYQVRIPRFYKTEKLIDYFGDHQIYQMNTLELFLLWRSNIKEWTSKKDREFYGISEEDATGLILLGHTSDIGKEATITNVLIEKEITSFSFDTEDGYIIIAILPQQMELVKSLLPLICENLSVDEYNLPYYFDQLIDQSHDEEDLDDIRDGDCIFCGKRTYGDTLCPNCSNNVD